MDQKDVMCGNSAHMQMYYMYILSYEVKNLIKLNSKLNTMYKIKTYRTNRKWKDLMILC